MIVARHRIERRHAALGDPARRQQRHRARGQRFVEPMQQPSAAVYFVSCIYAKARWSRRVRVTA